MTVRIAETVRDEFKKVAELRGSTMSGLMHQFIVMTIRQEKAASPHEFASTRPKLAPVVAHISGQPSRAEVQRMITDEETAEIESSLGTRSVPILKKKAK